MNEKAHNKIYSTFLVFLLTISLILTPLQSIALAESLDDKIQDVEEDLDQASADDNVQASEGVNNSNEETIESGSDNPNEENTDEDKSATNKNENIKVDELEDEVEIDYYYDFEVYFDEETVTTTDSITVTWSVNYDIVNEYILSVNDEEVATVSGDTTTYTFTSLTPGDSYDIEITAKTEYDVWNNNDYTWASPYWSDDELIPVSIITILNEDPDYESMLIRGIDENNKLFTEIDYYLNDVDEDIKLPLGKYEVIIYDADDPSISAREEIEIKEGKDYINNPIQLKFKLKEMREDAEPLDFKVSEVTDNSFTLTWNEVSKITGFKIHATNDKNEYFEIESGLINKEAKEYTLEGLSPDLIYSIDFFIDYIYDLTKWDGLFVKTKGEHAKAEKVEFENSALHESVKDRLGIHLRDATIADMKDLRYINANDINIDSLKGLEAATNLQSLNAYYNNLSDISILSHFPELSELDLDGNNITDITVLKDLYNLNHLDLTENEISSIDALSSLINLEYLSLSYNDISKLDALENLISLYNLSLSGNNVTDISALQDLIELRYLDLNDNTISNINVLANLVNLDELYLGKNNISTIPSLKGLSNLTHLSLYGNKITDIYGLSGLNNLTYLDLDNNNITDITALNELNSLDELYLNYNNITDISALTNLSNLEYLYLYDNNITNIPSLDGLESLTYLDLGENNITDISGLNGLNNLQELDLDYNNITDISVLKKLPSLHYVSLYGNDITDEETIQWLRNDGIEVYYDDEDDDWNDGWEDEDEDDIIIDREEVLQSFPEEDGFIVSEDGKDISVDLNKVSSNENFKLTEEQIKVLTENNQTLELNKGEVKTTIPSSAFDKSNEPVEITINEIESNPNSLSSTYDFTIKQGTRTISKFDEGVTLTFNVNADRAKNPNNMKVFYFNETTGKWENIGGQYNRSNGTVTVVTAHFSTFTVFEAEDEESDDIVVPKEEPTEPEEPEVPKEDKDNNDKTEPNDKDTLITLFPEKQGYEISKDNKLISIDLNKQKSDTVTLSKEQVKALDTLQTINVYKDGIKISISTSVFKYNGEEVTISAIKEKTAVNSVSNTYNITIKQGGKIISYFDEGITLTFDVNADLAQNPNSLKVFYFNEDTGNWENIGGNYNKVSKQVSVVTNHFSTFTVFEAAQDGSSNDIVPIADSNKSDNQKEEQAGQTNAQNNSILANVLPNTATNTFNWLLIGGLLLLVGGSIFLSTRFRTPSN